MTVSTGKYYTQMNASSFGTFPNDRLRLGDRLTQVTTGSGSTVLGLPQKQNGRPIQCITLVTLIFAPKLGLQQL